MSFDVRKSIIDAGYVAVGIGVLGVQQVQQRSRAIQSRLDDATAPFTAQADRAREVLTHRAEELSKRAQDVQAGVRDRVEPLVQRVRALV